MDELIEQTHVPRSSLTPFKHSKKTSREKIEKNEHVKNLIDSKLLMNKEFYKFLDELIKLNKTIQTILYDDNYPFDRRIARINRFSKLIREHSLMDKVLSDIDTLNIVKETLKKRKKNASYEDAINYFKNRENKLWFEKTLEQKLGELIRKEEQQINRECNRKLQQHSDEIQNIVTTFETKNNLNLDILVDRTVYTCKVCHNICLLDKFKITKCTCGRELTSSQALNKIAIKTLDNDVVQFIDSNMWLEHAVDRLLRMKNFTTFCGVYVLGHSGVWHELDNVAEYRLSRIVCECKTAEPNLGEAMVFSSKMRDIGCSRGYLFTVAHKVDKSVEDYCRHNSIEIVKNVLERAEKTIIAECEIGPHAVCWQR